MFISKFFDDEDIKPDEKVNSAQNNEMSWQERNYQSMAIANPMMMM